MSDRSKLIVQGAEQLLARHREEIAEEFGVHASPASRDVITPRLLEDVRESGNKKVKTNEDM